MGQGWAVYYLLERHTAPGQHLHCATLSGPTLSITQSGIRTCSASAMPASDQTTTPQSCWVNSAATSMHCTQV